MELGVCYYPEHWPESQWKEDAQKMKGLGLSLVRVGEFAWSRFEAKPGEYRWDWLERSLDILHAEGLKVILGTPTATPPKWLIDKHPEVLALDEQGKVRKFGSRRHYCFSSPIYREYSQGIVSRMAERFGGHPAVVAWQVDNEFGCHDTVRSYSSAAEQAFRIWCENKYQSIEKLNEAWGNVFWSMEYSDFASIDLPNLTVTEANPSHQWDFMRFSSDQVIAYSNMQVDIIRASSPGRDVLHNYMGNFTQYDQFKIGQNLDVATWDSYPLGFLLEGDACQEDKDRYFRTGHPDNTSLNHDMYRAVGKGRMWVMEQQPGPVNWAPYNGAPLDGMVKLWSWEAFSHGAEVVSYFRWRQAPFAQEQFHAALNLPNGQSSPVWPEIEKLKSEMDLLKDYDLKAKAEVAMVFDYESDWALRIVKHGEHYNPHSVFFQMYKTVKQLSVNVDIISQEQDLGAYKAVIIPNLISPDDAFIDRLKSFQGKIFIGSRSGSKTDSLCIPSNLAPGRFQDLIALSVLKVESMPKSIKVTAELDKQEVSLQDWREWVQTDIKPSYKSHDGVGYLYQNEKVTYLAAGIEDQALKTIARDFLAKSGVETYESRSGLRFKFVNELAFAFNYGPETEYIDDAKEILVGQKEVKAGEICIWKR